MKLNGHGFVILLFVFHIITSCTAQVLKELIVQFHGLTTFQILVSQKRRRTTYPRGPHGQRRKIHHGRYVIWLRAVFFTFACCQGEEWVCFQAVRLHQVRLSVSETLSLSLSLPLYRSFALSPSFHLVYYTYSQLDCIVSCHLASQHHS